MNAINIIRNSQHPPVWIDWIEALHTDGIKTVDIPQDQFFSDPEIEPEQTVIVDGLLPDLSGVIRQITCHSPNAHIIVVTKQSSFTVYYEALKFGATYITELSSPEKFVTAFHRAVNQNKHDSEDILPHWIAV
jgi:DNA-binding NtrC family response regulator